MRLYHTFLLLSASIVAINAACQAVALYQLQHVREAVAEYGSNWMPTVVAATELTRMLNEFRQLELRYALADSEQEMASLARRIGRQSELIRRAEERLRNLPRTPQEAAAFEHYLAARGQYREANRQTLAAMASGRAVEARDVTRMSAQPVAAMVQSLYEIERINQDLGRAAGLEAEDRYGRTVRAMLWTLAANVLAALGAALYAVWRISRPVSALARHMAMQDHGPPARPPADPPRGSPREVAVLYEAFRTLSGKLAASMERLAAMAVTDQLTGVSNRRRLMEEGAMALEICRRGAKPCSALMIDIDFFKKVNDTHGHAAGDAVLKTVAEALRASIRSSDILARYGGEEFAIVAPNSGLPDAVLLAGRLREAVEQSVAVTDAGGLKVTVSVGAATAGAETAGLDTLLSMADAALYRAKKNGRNRVEAQDVAEAA